MKFVSNVIQKKKIKDARIINFSHANIKRNLIIEMKETKNLTTLKKSEKRIITPHICGNCGYIELYVEDYKKLWVIYNEE